jgi:hypothetical protein
MKIKLDLFVKNYNGGPKIRIHANGKIIHETRIMKSGKQVVECDIEQQFPVQLIIEHYDKHMNLDTKVFDGKIVDDKGFKLEKVHIDECVLENELNLFDFIENNGHKDISHKDNPYIGFNGKFYINIDSEELIDWYFKLQKKFINQQEDFDYENFKYEIFQGKKYEVDY